MGFLYTFAIFIFLIFSIILCLIVLVQEGKAGLGASFGGGDSSDSLFGTSTPQVLKKFTAWLGAAFMIFCIILSFWTSSVGRHHVAPTTQIELQEEPE